MTTDSRTHYLALIAQATEAANAYYNGSEQVMTDEQYDLIIEELDNLSEENGWDDADALLNSVAAGTSEGGDVTHKTPMLSMNKAGSLDALKAFLSTVKHGVVVEPKFDGLAISGTYKNGVLVQLATRGNGITGESVTQRGSNITGLPQKINYKGNVEVRGEVFITTQDFKKASLGRLKFYYDAWLERNSEAKALPLNDLYVMAVRNRSLALSEREVLSVTTTNGKGNQKVSTFSPEKHIFANERNAVAGSLRNEDRGYEVPMNFSCYDVVDLDGTMGDSYTGRLEFMSNLGVKTSTQWMPADLGETPLEILDKFGELRKSKSLAYPTDGIVFKADSYAEREKFGNGSRHPHWALAYKYPSLGQYTVLREIIPSIGRTGRLALRGRFDRVLVDGSEVEYASLHNVSWLEQHDLRIGDTVSVRLAFEVIPQIDTFVAEKRPVDAVRWTPPAVCPQCGGEWDKSTLLWRCTSATCGELNSIIFAAGRDYFDWRGLSEGIITMLNQSGLVNDIADVFALTMNDLATLDTGRINSKGDVIVLGEKTAQKLYDSIQASKARPLSAIIAALGIRTLGRTYGRRLVKVYANMGELLKATEEDLMNVEGIGDTKAKNIYEGLIEKRDVIVRLAKQGVNMNSPVQNTASKIAGMKIVISGSVPGFTRTQLQERITELGATAQSGVSSSTSFLVADSSASGNSKYKKAQSLGVRIMSPEAFSGLIK